MVIHATHNLTVQENVAYHPRGHCYIVEEGGETQNTFYRNIGIWTRNGELSSSMSHCRIRSFRPRSLAARPGRHNE